MVIRLLAERPWCEACPVRAEANATRSTYLRRPSQDIHEVVSRARGGSITDVSNLMAVCRPCHDWITTHPAAAEELGLAKHSWER